MIGSTPGPLSPASQGEKQASELARASLNLHHLRNRITEGINANLPRETILPDILQTVIRKGLARGALLTLRRWAGKEPEHLVGDLDRVVPRWPDLRGKDEIKEAHAGHRVHWKVEAGVPKIGEACFSFCFSTNGRGAIALTAIGSPRADDLIDLKGFFSTEIESLLIRDHVLRAGGPGEPLKDMAELSWEALDVADDALAAARMAADGAPERMAAQHDLLMAVRRLCEYAHVDKGLAEVAACLLAVTRHVQRKRLSGANLDALGEVLARMRPIALSRQEADGCIARLREGGLSIYGTFGEDDYAPSDD